MPFIKRFLFATRMGVISPFQDAWQQRYLLLLLLKRDAVSRTSGTVLGALWLVLQPALQIIGFWFLIGIVLQVKFPGKVAFVDYFLVGMLTWLFISEVLNRSLNVLREFAGLYQRALFPLAILPLVPLLFSGILYGLVSAVVAALLEGVLKFPVGLLNILVLSIWLIPICYLLALLGLFFKDLGQFFPFLITLMLYVTPILYMPEMLPDYLQWVLWVNPLADIVTLVHADIQGMAWGWDNLLRLLGLWLLLVGPAWVLFRRAEPHMREML